MHRVLAALLLGLISFGLIAPAVSADVLSQLPACCRVHGKHHCAMKHATAGHFSAESGVSVSSVDEKCPISFQGGMLGFHSQTIWFSGGQVFFGCILNHPAIQAQTEARYRIWFNRSRQKRGPPSLFF